ncbi:MAG TPA: energy transducer TonB [Silvibacterium sp.]|nr:energy transducer TonB [Silvibacterium sp.]
MLKRSAALIPILLVALTVYAQTPAAPDPPLPKDPNQLMQLAARVNGLGSPDMKPWHLKATYQTYDADNKPKDQGTFEEWCASPDRYKISYSSSSFNQVQYHNGDKTWTTGDTGWVPFRLSMVQDYLVHPLRIPDPVYTQHFILVNKQLGAVSLVCADSNSSAIDKSPTSDSIFCFDPQKPVLRLERPDGNIFVLFNDTMLVNNQFVDKQILIEDSTHPIVKAEVTTLEFPSVPDPALVPPASAISNDRPTAAPGVMAGKRISGQDIKYPLTARQERLQGSVMLAAVIDKSGSIAELEVISGPKDLRESTVKAIQTWKYTPYLVNGKPVDVRTVINVDYSM